MKFLLWVKKHIILCFAIVAFPVALIVGGVNALKSKNEYDIYLADYNQRKEEAYLSSAHLPKSIEIINGYVTYGDDEITATKSAYKNNYLYFARDGVVAPLSEDNAQEYKKIDPEGSGKLNEYISSLDRSGGAITFRIEAEKAGYADIAIEMKSNWINDEGDVIGYDNLTDYFNIQFNKLEVKTTNLGLPEGGEKFTTVVFKDVNLLEGNNTLVFTTNEYNPYKTNENKILYIIPDIRNVSVMTEVNVIMPEAE